MDKNLKHKIVMSVYDDDSVEFEFEGVSGWHIGKMQRQLGRAARYLKAEHRKLRQAGIKADAEQLAAKQIELEKAQAVRHQVDAVNAKIRQAADSGETDVVAILKKQLANMKPTEGVTDDAADTRADGGDAGEAAAVPPVAN